MRVKAALCFRQAVRLKKNNRLFGDFERASQNNGDRRISGVKRKKNRRVDGVHYKQACQCVNYLNCIL